MKIRALLLLAALSLLITLFVAAVPGESVAAKVCYDPKYPNKIIPCPEKKQKTATPVPPTRTSTPTETPTQTATSTPTLTPVAIVGPSPAASGFACPPFNNGMLLGAGLLGAGLITLALAGRGLFNSNGFRNTGSGSAPPDWGRPADPIGGGPSWDRQGKPNQPSSGWIRVTQIWRGRGSGVRQTSLSGLPSMNQSLGSGPAVTRLLGGALSGLGVGVLGAGLLGGAAGMSCTSAAPVLTSGAALGTIGLLMLSILLQNIPPHSDTHHDETYSTFERIGAIEDKSNPGGSSGLHKNLPLQ
jgi:hypothetical protein